MKPGDFLIGVLDFFAILLPGSMATWLVTRYLPPGEMLRLLSFGPGNAAPDDATLWAAFLLSSYVFGHFVFLAGARLDTSYDRWRRRTKPTDSDRSYQAANDLRKRLTPSLTEAQFSTLKWAKAFIQLQGPAARTEIDRLEADSKFFRSLVVVSVAIGLHFLLRERAPGLGLGCFAVSFMAYRRYIDQRWKMTELSYSTVVILDATRPAASPPSATPADTHES
jgi:hypothetical protein